MEVKERREGNKKASRKDLQGVLVGIRHRNHCSGAREATRIVVVNKLLLKPASQKDSPAKEIWSCS